MRRVVTLDVLRGVAIVCMLTAHGVPFLRAATYPEAVTLALAAVNMVASPLFGLVMGASAALVWSRSATVSDRPRRVLADVGRGVTIYVLGMMLVGLQTWVAIVLHVLGVLMILGVPVAALAGTVIRSGGVRIWVLGGVTAGLFLLAPSLTGALVPAGERLANGTTGGWLEVWVALAAGYSYRALSLLPFFALGALLATTGSLERPRLLAVRCAPVAAGMLLALGLGWFGSMTLSGDAADQWRDLTLVATAIALASLLVGWGGAVCGPLVSALADLGAIALSLYALQIVVLKPMMSWSVWQSSPAWGWACLALLVLVPSVAMITWRRTLGPGPLEHLVALVTGKGQAT